MAEKFFIQNGVRRALASREDGRKTVPAILYREGRPPELFPRMRLSKLYTSKKGVPRDVRFLRIVPPIESPIEIEPLGEAGQPRAVPLAFVQLR
jgi:hypothetical protein